MRKKLIIPFAVVGLMASPLIALANISSGWNTPSTNAGYITPNLTQNGSNNEVNSNVGFVLNQPSFGAPTGSFVVNTSGNVSLSSKTDIDITPGRLNGLPKNFNVIDFNNNNDLTVLGFNGNVGIGTTSPTSPLSVTGDAFVGGNILMYDQVNGQSISFGPIDGAVDLNYPLLVHSNPIITGSPTFDIENNQANSQVIQVETGNIPILFVEYANSAGFIGDGTSSPWRTLSVKGSSDLGTNALAGSFTGTSTATSTLAGGISLTGGCFSVNSACLTSGSTLTGTVGQIAYFTGTNTAAGTSTITIATSKNVGIATSSPWNTFSVLGTSTADLFQFNTGTIFGYLKRNSLWIQNMPTSTPTGQNNTFVGVNSGTQLTSGSSNLGIGSGALRDLITGSNDIGIGLNACGGVISFNNNTCIGSNAGQNAQAANIVYIGTNAALNSTSTTAGSSVVIGANAARALAGDNDVFLGATSGGQSPTIYNTSRFAVAIGSNAGSDITAADGGVIIGAFAGSGLTTGTENTIIGDAAGEQVNTEGSNTFIGSQAGQQVGGLGNGGGTDNTAIGYQALFNNSDVLSTLSFTTAIGESSLAALDTGVGNIGIGFDAASGLTDGSYNIFIGQNVDATSSTESQGLNIGNILFGTGVYSSNIPSSAPATGGAIGIGTTTLSGGIFNLGRDAGSAGTTTIATSKIQWDGYDSGGTHRCFFFDASGNITHSNGACVK